MIKHLGAGYEPYSAAPRTHGRPMPEVKYTAGDTKSWNAKPLPVNKMALVPRRAIRKYAGAKQLSPVQNQEQPKPAILDEFGIFGRDDQALQTGFKPDAFSKFGQAEPSSGFSNHEEMISSFMNSPSAPPSIQQPQKVQAPRSEPTYSSETPYIDPPQDSFESLFMPAVNRIASAYQQQDGSQKRYIKDLEARVKEFSLSKTNVLIQSSAEYESKTSYQWPSSDAQYKPHGQDIRPIVIEKERIVTVNTADRSKQISEEVIRHRLMQEVKETVDLQFRSEIEKHKEEVEKKMQQQIDLFLNG